MSYSFTETQHSPMRKDLGDSSEEKVAFNLALCGQPSALTSLTDEVCTPSIQMSLYD